MQTTGQTDFSFLATPLAALGNDGLVAVADATVGVYNFLLDYGPQAPLEAATAEEVCCRLEDIYAETEARIASASRVSDASPLVLALYRLIYHAGDFDLCTAARVAAFHASTVRVVEADAAAPSLPECEALLHRLHLYVRMTEAEQATLESALRAALARWAAAPATPSEQMQRLNVYYSAKVLFPLSDHAEWAAAALEGVTRCALAELPAEALFRLCDLLPVLRQRDVCPMLETDGLPAALTAELQRRLGAGDDLALRCRLLLLELARREDSLQAAEQWRDAAPAAAADPLATEELSARLPVYALQALACSYALRYSLHAVCPDEEGLRNGRWCLLRLAELHAALREKTTVATDMTERLRLLAILADIDNVLAGHDPLLTHDACNFVFRTAFPLLETYNTAVAATVPLATEAASVAPDAAPASEVESDEVVAAPVPVATESASVVLDATADAAAPAYDASLEAAAMRLTQLLMADILPEDRAADELWQTLVATARRWTTEPWTALPPAVALVRAEVLHTLSWQDDCASLFDASSTPADAQSALLAATSEACAAILHPADSLSPASPSVDIDTLFQLYHTVSTLSAYPGIAAALDTDTLYPQIQQKARLAASPAALLLLRCMEADSAARTRLFGDETING